MGGEFTYLKWDPIGFDPTTGCEISEVLRSVSTAEKGFSARRSGARQPGNSWARGHLFLDAPTGNGRFCCCRGSEMADIGMMFVFLVAGDLVL